MKKIVAIFLIFTLIFSFTLPSYATVFEGLKTVDPTTDLSPEGASANRGSNLPSDKGEQDSGEGNGLF